MSNLNMVLLTKFVESCAGGKAQNEWVSICTQIVFHLYAKYMKTVPFFVQRLSAHNNIHVRLNNQN